MPFRPLHSCGYCKINWITIAERVDITVFPFIGLASTLARDGAQRCDRAGAYVVVWDVIATPRCHLHV